LDKKNHFFASGFQVRVRANGLRKAHEKCEECRTTLDRIGKFKVGKVRYDNVLMSDESLPLKKDENGRHIYIVNGVARRQEKESE